MSKPSKYRNVRTVLDGIWFDSKAEANRYAELLLLLRAGEITTLQLQPRYPLEVKGQVVCTYVADFAYRTRDGAMVVEDVKSSATRGIAGFRLKARLFEAIHGFPITITGKGIRA